MCLTEPAAPAVPATSKGAAELARLFLRCDQPPLCSLCEVFVVAGNFEHGALGLGIVHLVRDATRFRCAGVPVSRAVEKLRPISVLVGDQSVAGLTAVAHVVDLIEVDVRGGLNARYAHLATPLNI